MENLHDVLLDNLKDLLNAEKQLVKALPKMAKAASDETLKEALEEHLEVTRGQVNRLEQVFSEIGETAKGKKCKGMEGLIAEGEEVLGEKKKNGAGPALDAAIIVAAQKVEHYEIAAYGSARTFAEVLGLEEAARLLEETLEEENEADKKLNEIAENINSAAAESSKEDMEEDEEDEDETEAASSSRGRGGSRRRAPATTTRSR